MPVYSLNVTATSPVIKFEGDWTFQEGTATAGNAIDSATISFAFNGTSLSVLGEHLGGFFPCSYHVSIDGDDTSLSVQQDSIFFSEKNLPHIPHNVTFSHLDDLGCPDTVLTGLMLSLGDGNTETKSTEATMNKDSSNVTYSGAWELGNGNHSTSKTTSGDGSTRLSFYGNGISIYGSIGPKFGAYNVNLDGVSQIQRNASSAIDTENELLFFAHNLTSGLHDLVLTNIPLDRSTLLGFNSAVVTAYDIPVVALASSISTTSSGTKSADILPPTDSPTPTPSPRKSHTGAIAGGAIGGLLAFGLLGFLFFILTRRHFRRRYAPPRFNTILEDGQTSTSDAAQRPMAEVDMPPPDYRGVFPSEFGGAEHELAPSEAGTAAHQDEGLVANSSSFIPTPVSYGKREEISRRQRTEQLQVATGGFARNTRKS